jgi:hypothetical protein
VSSRGYTILGWLVWRIGKRVAMRKLAQNRSRLGAAAVVVAVVLAGIALAAGDEDE